MTSWLIFWGTWLLVAGPVYQGARELAEEDAGRRANVPVYGLPWQPLPAGLWWLLPPVMVVLRFLRVVAYRRRFLAQLSPSQRVQREGFLQKAMGWFVVAAGASLLAISQTWELTEHMQWPGWVFVLVLIAMFTLTIWGAQRAVVRKRAHPGTAADTDP